MQQVLKQHNLTQLNKQHKLLIGANVALAMSTLTLGYMLTQKEDKWVVLPMSSPEQHITLTSKGYSTAYLDTWARHLLQTLLTCSQDTVDAQLEELRAISASSSNKENTLEHYFKAHGDFIKGSHISSCFFPKEIKPMPSLNQVKVLGNFKYWLGGESNSHSIDKQYIIHYKAGPRGVILLSKIEEIDV